MLGYVNPIKPDMRRIQRTFGKTPLTTLFKPKNHFLKTCKLMVAPMGGTHGEFFFFFKLILGRIHNCQGYHTNPLRRIRRMSGQGVKLLANWLIWLIG